MRGKRFEAIPKPPISLPCARVFRKLAIALRSAGVSSCVCDLHIYRTHWGKDVPQRVPGKRKFDTSRECFRPTLTYAHIHASCNGVFDLRSWPKLEFRNLCRKKRAFLFLAVKFYAMSGIASGHIAKTLICDVAKRERDGFLLKCIPRT